jgi:uncharacterized protein (TIGR00369 family)
MGYGIVSREILAGRAGLDVLADIAAGNLPQPPIARTLNFRLVEVAPGLAVFEGEPTIDFYNPLGAVHGGWPATLLDSAMACAVHTTLPAGQAYTTVEFKLNCIRPITEATGRVRCEGRVVNAGRTIATSEGSLLDASGKLLAHGTETCLIFSAPTS